MTLRKADGRPLLLDKALLCITLDVIGRIGFAKDFGAAAGFAANTNGTAPFPGPGVREGHPCRPFMQLEGAKHPPMDL